MEDRDALIRLANLLAAHDGVTHWAISMRATRKGDFFYRLTKGADCQTETARRVLRWFSDHWPEDLPWPADIPRPPRRAKEVA